MRRLSIVMAVAALDTYMHRLILERAFKHDELPKQLAQLDVSFKQLLSLPSCYFGLGDCRLYL